MKAIEYKGQRVITMNFKNQRKRFAEGRHYFLLAGEELKAFKNCPNHIGLVDKHTPSLYLWTERGAGRHCKILDTDKAWEQFDNLEETYFRVKESPAALRSAPESFKYLNGFANFLNSICRVMKDEGHTPEAIAAQVKLLCAAYGVPMIGGFAKPDYEQLSMPRIDPFWGLPGKVVDRQ